VKASVPAINGSRRLIARGANFECEALHNYQELTLILSQSNTCGSAKTHASLDQQRPVFGY